VGLHANDIFEKLSDDGMCTFTCVLLFAVIFQTCINLAINVLI